MNHLLVAIFGLWLPLQSFAASFLIRQYSLGEADVGAVDGTAATQSSDDLSATALTLSGSPLYTAQVPPHPFRPGLALRFNGSNYGSAAGLPSLNDNFAVELWVRPASTNSAVGALLYNGDPAANGWGLLLQNGSVFARIGGLADFGSTVLPVNTWSHVALIRDSGVATFFVNGAVIEISTATPIPAVGSLAIAAAPSALDQVGFDGILDTVRILGFSPGGFSVADLNYPSRRIFIEGTTTPTPTLYWALDLPWTVQTSTNLASDSWTDLVDPPIQADGFNQLGLQPLSTSHYFRLSTAPNPIPSVFASYTGRLQRRHVNLSSTDVALEGELSNTLKATVVSRFDALGSVDPMTGLATSLSFHWEVYAPRFYASQLGVSADAPFRVHGFSGQETPVFSIGPNSLASLNGDLADSEAQYWRVRLIIRHGPFEPEQAATQETESWFRFGYARSMVTLEQATTCQSFTQTNAICPFENATYSP